MGYKYLKEYANANNIWLGNIYTYERYSYSWDKPRKNVRRDATNDNTMIVFKSRDSRCVMNDRWYIDYEIRV